jgi:hypothetical protein
MFRLHVKEGGLPSRRSGTQEGDCSLKHVVIPPSDSILPCGLCLRYNGYQLFEGIGGRARSSEAILAAMLVHLLSSLENEVQEEDCRMPYYVLARAEGGLYAMNLALSEEEARRYAREGEMEMVTAVFVWTGGEDLENFRQLLSITQGDPNSPFRELIQDMTRGAVDVLDLSAEQLRDRLVPYRRVGFVAIDPGPEQRLLKIDEFLEGLSD